MGISVTPLLGVSSDGPLCYLLQIDDANILLDLGWTDSCDPEVLAPLADVCAKADALLLSHPSVAHMGGVSYAFASLGLKCPIFSTLATHRLGKLCAIEHCLAVSHAAEEPPFTLADVEAAFKWLRPLGYQEPASLRGRSRGISIAAYPSGHMVGGAVWRISKGGEDVVYAPDVNHRRERALSGGNLAAVSSRPAVLILGAAAPLDKPLSVPERDQALIETVMRTLRAGGNVLLPVDAVGRLLELVLVLEAHWARMQLYMYQLVLVSATSRKVFEYAQSQVTYMSDELVASVIGGGRDGGQVSFNTRHFKRCASVADLREKFDRRRPMAVVATTESLDVGPGRRLLADWARDPKNAIVFTKRAAPGTLAHRLQGLQGASRAGESRLTEDLPLAQRVAVAGAEVGEGDELGAGEGAGGGAIGGSRAQEIRQAVRAPEGEEARADVAEVVAQAKAHGEVRDDEGGAGELGVREGYLTQFKCLVDGFTVPEHAVGPMFPDEFTEDQRPNWDFYGEEIREGEFAMIKPETRVERPEGAGAAGSGSLLDTLDAVSMFGHMGVRQGTQIARETARLQLAASVAYVPYDGRADGRSLQAMAAQLGARGVVLVHGEDDVCDALSTALLATPTQKPHVQRPQRGQAVDVSPQTASFVLRLGSSLLSNARLRTVGEYMLGFVEGQVSVEGLPDQDAEMDEPEGPVRAPTAFSYEEPTPPDPDAKLPVLKAAAVTRAGAGNIFIGSAKLSELKQALAAAGLESYVTKETLVLPAGRIVVRRNPATGEMQIEGPLSRAFYAVREVVYGQFSIC
ncbi:unnamed protein product [Pedinophyceae sp. YPF-701]|nr:unnamed protein product [Pedinophyceae sp. YPF-701]